MLSEFAFRCLSAGYRRMPSKFRQRFHEECQRRIGHTVSSDAVPPRPAISHEDEQIIPDVRSFYRYDQDGLATNHNCDFIENQKFATAYEAGVLTNSWGGSKIHWRAYVACWAATQAMQIEGDFVECGVNRGGLARTVLEFVDLSHSGRSFYLLDTYRGLVADLLTPEELTLGIKPGGYEECLSDVRQTFAPFPCCIIVPGTVPDTLVQIKSKKIAYLSIDMNCVTPEIAAATTLWPRMSPGAVMLLDDYGWEGHEIQKRAFDEFAASKGTLVLPLPTGQGIIVKS
jgi:O-methyltransferase